MVEQEVRTIMAPMKDGFVMLPVCTVAEVMDFKPPKPFKRAPGWLLGELAWRGWQVPVISYERLINGDGHKPVVSKARILVVKTLGESTLVNYIGLLTQGLPKLMKVTAATLEERPAEQLPDAVFSRVSINGLQAVIPMIDKLTRTVEKAAYET